jgi:1-deoxy-D-xylulose-5-phosphate reductoisomerase
MKKRVAVLGATGSIGKNTLDVLRNERDRFEPVLFSARQNAEELQKLKKEFPGAMIVLGDGLEEAIASVKAEITVNGISGAAGLAPSAAAIRAGSALALANKETIVMAGPLILDLKKKNMVPVIPVDSEHSAIFKLLEAHGKNNVAEIILTASGGPFRKCTTEELSAVTPGNALLHPTWNMGPKISVDSATLANKGLEVIEAAGLFGFPPERIRVVVHPQSIVHSMIRLKDGAVYAQMSKPDMRLPIHEALTWPETEDSPFGILDFDNLSLSFEKCDLERFPMLALAYEALREGPFLPAVYNAANEKAVEAFFRGGLGFLEISSLVGYVINESRSFLPQTEGFHSMETVLELDRKARELAERYLQGS